MSHPDPSQEYQEVFHSPFCPHKGECACYPEQEENYCKGCGLIGPYLYETDNDESLGGFYCQACVEEIRNIRSEYNDPVSRRLLGKEFFQ